MRMTRITDSHPLVLASRSPRRSELLALVGLPFVVQASDAPETPLPGEAPEDYVRRLSCDKARAAAALLAMPAWVLAADTIVVDDGELLGKPRDADEARAMLRRLRGRVHHVFTAITLLHTGEGQLHTAVACSPVPMRAYSDAEIEAYIASNDPFDKAGAYAIQHAGFQPVQGFAHCFANVMGLPLCHLARLLHEPGIELPADVAATCQAHLNYTCPVYPRILAGME